MKLYRLTGLLLAIGMVLAQGARWEAPLGEPIRDVTILSDGSLLVSTAKSVRVLSGETGQELWRCQECRDLSDPNWRPIHPLSPYLYESRTLEIEVAPAQQGPTSAGMPNLPAPEGLTYLMARDYLILNTKTGKVLYSGRNNRRFSVVVSRLFVPEANVLILLGRGPRNPQKAISAEVPIIAAYDVETGAELFRKEAFKASTEPMAPVGLVSDGERVFYMSADRLYAMRARTGEMLWQTSLFRWFGLNVRPRLFIDREREQLLVFARGQLGAYRFSDGTAVWANSLKVPRLEILAFFSTPEGILLFTDDRQSQDDPSRGGRDLLVRPLAFLIDPVTGENRWGERLKVPGLFVGYVPLDEGRILTLFARERFFASRGPYWTPDKDWNVVMDILDVRRGTWLLRNPLTLRGGILSAARIPGGFLVQTTQAIRAYDEDGNSLWERRIRRPMSLPFYITEEGSDTRVFFIDETGQTFVWKGPGTQPEPFGKPLPNFTGRDEPQGLLWQNKRLHIWGTSSLYILDERREITQSFVREVPGFSAPVRMLGVALAVGGTAARWALARQVTWLRSPEDQLPEIVQLRRAIQENPLYAADLKEAQKLGDILFLFGRDGNQVKAYAVRLSDASVAFEKALGPQTAFGSLKDVLIDPQRQRFYLIASNQIQAY